MITRTPNASLLKYNTLGIDCTCSMLITYDCLSDLHTLFDEGAFRGRWLQLGAGANTLFECSHFDGTVIHSVCKDYKSASEGDSMRVTAANGWVWDDLVRHMMADGCYGAENLSGIPASSGGAVVQNIGAYGMEIHRLITEVTTFDTRTGKFSAMTHDECNFAYRTSAFKHIGCPIIVAAAAFTMSDARSWTPCLEYAALRAQVGEAPTPQQIREAVIRQRDSKLPNPAVLGNCGSFFVNPVVSQDKATELASIYPDMPQYSATGGIKLAAGWLIDRAGMKGYCMGNAAVDEKNALVLVNAGNATGADIMALAACVVSAVRQKFGVELTPEVNVVKD